MNTEYKGFNVIEADQTYIVAPTGHTYCANGFNRRGYASLTAAKGAITKHLQAVGAEPLAGSLPASKAASNNDANHASMTSGLEDDVGNGEDALISLDSSGESVLSAELLQRGAHTAALLRYSGYSKYQHSDKRSRNQREGRLAGYVDGKPHRYYTYVLEVVTAKEIRALESFTTAHYTKTRKHRKARKMQPRISQFF